ncbi:MAG: hypothetical protein HY318_18290 [Armatimonadetes bacterium]|nr:hypothetical protein [Armatimonadota bacterium]
MIVSFVGAGSFDFTGPALRSLIPVAGRHGLQINLCDHDPDSLAAMATICQRLAREAEVSLAVEPFAELGPAVAEAAFVVTTLNHGGLEADIADFWNARDHGFYPKHVDTIGPAGWLRALRMGAFMQRLLSALPGGATVLNLSNPLSIIVRMAHRRGFRAVGFCHGAMNRRSSFRSWLGLTDNPDMEVWGTNHLTYMTTLSLSGRDLYPDLVELLRNNPEHRNWQYNLELYERHGIMPVLEAQHTADFFPGLNDPQSIADYGLHLWEYDSRRVNVGNRRKRMAAFASGEEPIANLHESQEGVAEAIDGLLGGTPHRGILNAPLASPANGIPAGAVVESWLTVDGTGVRFDLPPNLPQEIQQHLQRIQVQQDLAAEAFESGDMGKLMEVYMLEPNCKDKVPVKSMLRRALNEHERLLPDAWRLTP